MITQLEKIKEILSKRLHLINGVHVCGGAIRDMLSGETPKDYDIFATDVKSLANYIKHLRKNGFKIKQINKRISCSTFIVEKYGNTYKLDLVKKYGNVKEIIDMFDFTVCCFGINRKEVVFNKNAPFDLLSKKLMINNLPLPMATMKRLEKFVKKGYTYCNGVVYEISKSIQELDPKRVDDFWEDYRTKNSFSKEFMD